VLCFVLIKLGGAGVAELKRIVVSLPDNLLEKVDYFVALEPQRTYSGCDEIIYQRNGKDKD
jgi:hypothetical protein